MPTLSKLLVAAAAAAVFASPAAGQTVNHTVGFEVRAINELAIRGTTVLTISPRKAGSAATVSTASASYAITTNEDNRRITVAIDSPLPAGVTVKMNMDAPEGAVSNDVILSPSAQTVVTGISRLTASGLAITYSMTATAAANVSTTSARTVTITIASGA